MSKLPRPGGIPVPKVVKSTSTKTVNLPKTNKTVTQTQTTITQIESCPTDASTVSRGRSTGAADARCPPPAPCGLRSARGTPVPGPSSSGRGQGLRPPSGAMGRPQTVPTVGPGGGSRGICPGQPGLLSQPGAMSTPIPSAASVGPSDSRPAGPSGLRPPGTSGLRPPGGSCRRGASPSGLRAPTPIGQLATAPAQGNSATCSGGGRASSCAKSLSASGSGIRPPGGQPASGLRPPSGSTSGLRTPGPSQSQGSGPCHGSCGKSGRGIPQARPGASPAVCGNRPVAKPIGPCGLRPSGLRPPQVVVPEITIEEVVHSELMNKSAQDPTKKVTAKSGRINRGLQEMTVDTPAGRERLLQQAVLEKRVERSDQGERIIKNLSLMDKDRRTGKMKKIEMGLQQMDPRFARDKGKEVIGIISKVSMSPSYATVTQECTRATTEVMPEAANMTVAEIATLVDQEKEDVDNTLKMLPPDLELKPGKFEMKKRLQNLRLNSESMALLEQSIINPEPEPDDAQEEPSPEMMAAMMHTVEKGVPPQSAPEQVFNALFTETTNERFIQLSPITQGPLQDVVIPTKISYDVHKEVVCGEIEVLTEKLQNVQRAEDYPPVDIFSKVMDDGKKSPTKGKNKDKSFPQISDEKSLWMNANLEHLVNIVGAEPAEVLDPANLEELETSGTLEEELSHGMEYYVDVDPVQYMSRVQLRGTQEPHYFPGYLVALPDFPEVIKLARSPDEVFASAWKSVQPRYFPDESMQSMIY